MKPELCPCGAVAEGRDHFKRPWCAPCWKHVNERAHLWARPPETALPPAPRRDLATEVGHEIAKESWRGPRNDAGAIVLALQNQISDDERRRQRRRGVPFNSNVHAAERRFNRSFNVASCADAANRKGEP